ncbi:MAG: hypothetical protein CMH83_02735 [Nocardioides sp.]|nr:hypothetical protein [Nocardioides sp.]
MLAALAVLAGCSASGEPEAAPTTSATPTETATPTPPPTAEPVPRPEADACYDLTYDEVVAPVADDQETVRCNRAHTSQTFRVGRIDNLVEGHLLAVDSDRVQDAVAETCTDRLRDAVGATTEQLRLSVLRAVWFTPTLEESDAGADWYRCDVVATEGADGLASVKGSLRDVLADQAGRDRLGMCGTAAPDADGFSRVPCRDDHSWRAVSVVELEPGDYPGQGAVADAAEEPCRSLAESRADDPLDYEWGFEGPDKQQWRAGQTFVRCWLPD